MEAGFNHETRNVKRFVLDTDTDFSSIAYFWLEKDVVINSNNVTKTLQLENSGKNLSGSSTLPAKVTAKIASTSAGTNMGKKFALTNLDDSTFSSVEAQPWAEFAQDANRTKTYVGKIRLFTGTGASESGRNFVSTYTWDSSTNSIDDVHVGVDGTFTRVEFINVIPTNSGTGRDFSSNYKNCLVDFTRSSVNSDNENVEEVQTRTIVDATTSRTVLLVDSPWDGTVPGTIPNTSNESYQIRTCLLYTSPSPRDGLLSRMPSSA